MSSSYKPHNFILKCINVSELILLIIALYIQTHKSLHLIATYLNILNINVIRPFYLFMEFLVKNFQNSNILMITK
jgi:hypothetical protein